MEDRKVTVEYYGDALLVKLIGAVDVPEKRTMEAAHTIGKAICKALNRGSLDAVLIDANGEKTGQIVIRR